ncbi:MAG: hypothetical protein ACLGHN_02250 [Bacteriovoracia bacterium]
MKKNNIASKIKNKLTGNKSSGSSSSSSSVKSPRRKTANINRQ